jgi:hypothetical protein
VLLINCCAHTFPYDSEKCSSSISSVLRQIKQKFRRNVLPPSSGCRSKYQAAATGLNLSACLAFYLTLN